MPPGNASQKINEAHAKLQFTPLKGVFKGFVKVTPSLVKKRAKRRNSKSYARFKFNALDNVRVLETLMMNKDDGSKVNLHIYEGGLKFPDLCPVSLEKATHYDILETTIQRQSLGKVLLEGKDPQRTFDAMGSDRFWYAIPFSENHGIEDGAVDMLGSDMSNNFRIYLTNKEYALEFAKLNNLEGVWLRMKHHVIMAFAYVGLIIFGALTALSGIMLYQGLAKEDWGTLSLPIVVIGGSIGLLMLIVSIIAMIRGNRGEALI